MVQQCRPETVAFYAKVYEEVKDRADHRVSSVRGEEKYRLLWHNQIPWYAMDLLDWMADEFGATTMNDAYSGQEPPRESMIDYDFPLESYALWKYDKGGGVSALGRRL